jgi:hypothetical protein
MATKSGNYVLLDDGTWAQQVQIAGTDASSSSTGALGVNVKQSDAIVPVDIQNRLASTIQTHSGVVVAATTGVADSVWFDSDGFTDIAFTMMNDAATASALHIYWSNDNSTTHGLETNVLTGTQQQKAGQVSIKARYFKVRLANTDAAPHTMSAWVLLKA